MENNSLFHEVNYTSLPTRETKVSTSYLSYSKPKSKKPPLFRDGFSYIEYNNFDWGGGIFQLFDNSIELNISEVRKLLDRDDDILHHT
jgi:hypothetical protein